MLLGCLLLAFSALLTVWSGHLLIDSIFATKTISYEGIGIIRSIYITLYVSWLKLARDLYGSIGKLCIEIA